LKQLLLGGATFVAAGLLAAMPAQADTFNFTSCHISGSSCNGGSIGAPGFGSVTLTQVGTSVTFDATLINGNTFIETGSGGQSLFLFNDTISGSTITNITATLNGATVAIPGGLTGVTNTSVMADGTGTFTAVVKCTATDNTCNPGMIPTINDLHFTVTNATLAQLETANANGNLFVADILCGSAQTQCGGLTGPVDVTPLAVPGPTAGAGLPGLLAACGGLFFLARRRKQAGFAA
jgi:hypothetical protein